MAGIGLMLLGVFLFSCNDALGKWLLGVYGVGQMLLIRSTAAVALLAVPLARSGSAPFRQAPRPALQVFRVLLSTAEVTMFFVAVSYLPLADTVSFYLAGPIYVAALSALFLGERVTLQGWIAVLIGFLGVLIALQPSSATLTGPALIALAGSIAFAILMIVTRHLRGTADIVLVAGQVIGTLLYGLVIAPFGWIAPSGRDLLAMVLLGVIATAALFCVNRSLKLAPASTVVPYQYTLIVWAMILGVLVFGDQPQPHMLAGSAAIVAAGLFLFWHERGRADDLTPPA
jgi:drug/metabolite transporter (DMT)-like permease